MTPLPPSGRDGTWARLLTAVLAVALVGGSTVTIAPTVAGAVPAAGSAPVLNLSDGQTLEGTVEVNAEPAIEDDSVVSLSVDGRTVDAERTAGTAHFGFDMGGNGTEARYHNYITVNGHTTEAEHIFFPDIPGGRSGTLDFPGAWLHTGINKITVRAGWNWVDTTNANATGVNQLPNGEGLRCPNYDDFALSSLSLSLLGVVADGEQNNFSYTFGDGTCGSSARLLSQDLTFVVSGEPGSTAGLAADLDTTTLSNGTHTVAATTRSGATTQVTVRVNNAPAGAPKVTPADGALVRGTQPVIAAGRDGSAGAVESLAVDDDPAENAETLAAGTATFGLTIEAGNSLEAKYHNYLLVNGNRVDLGGDYGVSGAEDVTLEFPHRYLHPGDNVIQVKTGDYNGTLNGKTCANHDDFKVTRASVNLALGTDGTVTTGTTYLLTTDGGSVTKAATTAASLALGDGTCGPNKEAEFHFDIAGAPTTRTVETLRAGGDAHLRVFVGGNGSDNGYDNRVLINGIPLNLGIWEKEVADLSFPNEWLSPGVNVVEFVAGSDHGSSKPGGCDNYDDYTLRDFELVPLDGEATQLTRQIAGTTVTIGSASYPVGQPVTVFIGDGTCGSSFNATLTKTILFDIAATNGDPLPALGRRADVDTAQLTDGEHSIKAVVGDKTSTRRFTTDNTAPVVASSVPAEGQKLTSTVALVVEIKDASGVAGTPVITLDGNPVAQGDQIGHGLPAGAHTIAVTATDTLGNSATREIHFTSANIPDVPTALNANVTGANEPSAVLSATIPAVDGVPLTATFTKADIVLPTAGYQGEATAVPTTLDVAHDAAVRVDSLRPLDGRTVDTPSGRDVVFQRYDLNVGKAATPTLRWEGTIDPERVVALRVWDPAHQKWVVLTSSRGQAEQNTVLAAPLGDEYRDGGTVHVMVTGEDPFADDLSPRDSSAQNDKDRFEDPGSYDFALAHFTDTQYLTEGAAGGTYDNWNGKQEPSDIETAEEQAIWAAAYRDTTQWIADNQAGRKIAYTAHTGDIIENDYYDPLAKNPDGSLQRPGLNEQVDKELAAASSYQKILDDNGVVNQVIAGNHDNQLGAENGPDSRFSRSFSADRYYRVAKSWPAGTEYHAWDEKTNADGTVTPGKDNQNNYVLFSAGGLDFVAVGLSYGVTAQEAKWADSIFKRYKDRNGILLSHDYLKPSTNPDGRGAEFSAPDGSPLYKQVVESNPNVFLVLAGHEHGVGTNVRSKVGVTVAHDVVELLADYQFYTVSAGELWPDLVDGSGNIDLNGDGTPDHKAGDRLQFGASFLRLLQFDVDRAVMHIDTYSPFLDNFGATEYDIRQDGSQTKPRYNGAEDNLTLPVDLTTRKTSFATDSLGAYVPSGVIGTDEVTANGTATVTWSRLAPATSYGWIVEARSADGGVAAAQPAVFRTRRGEPTVTATAAPTEWGTAATVTVKVTAGSAPVTGTVELREGSTVRGSVTLSGSTATFPLPVGLAAGDHTLTASYSGSDQLDPAQATVTVTVNLPPEWSASTQYKADAKVSYQGRPYLAAWTSKNQRPGDPNGAWQELAMTEDGATVWTASRIFNAGDVVTYHDKTFRARWYARNQQPGDPNGPWEEIAPPAPGNGPAAWTPTTVYHAGDRVTYQKRVYEAKWYTRNQQPGDPNGPWKLIG
ncbi:carbohydrate-binding protein [Micromonospora eburnea]|uniref:Carbohydrate binding domain-containing protein n=1 Tax=Micromonospora eburnea TaxID=227316 RepID=A0A1C6UUY5_9ACTN|nr:carbohydrate-binding protein [Micromonospora eburnea]SCL57673.1 Carbohydrate binding domain-containing protein [Micromonospora eburnea]